MQQQFDQLKADQKAVTMQNLQIEKQLAKGLKKAKPSDDAGLAGQSSLIDALDFANQKTAQMDEKAAKQALTLQQSQAALDEQK